MRPFAAPSRDRAGPAVCDAGLPATATATATEYVVPRPGLGARAPLRRSDNSPASWLSSALLLTLSITALRLTAERCLPWRLGVWLTIAFGALALDEQFMLHELWKFRCHKWTDACRWSAVREAPMLAVAVVGLLTMAWLHRALSHRSTRNLLWTGFGVGLMAIGVDQWPEVQPQAPWLPELPALLAALEEAFEVVAEALLLGALLRAPGNVPVNSSYLSSSH